MSSGWLDALLPGKTLPLDEPRLTDFEALNPLLGRTPDDSTERRIVCPARGFPAKRCRRTSSDWLGALSRQNHSVGRAAPAQLRSAEPAARTGVLRRFYEAERPLPPLWRVDFRRSAAAGRTPVGLARGFPAGFFCGTNRALRRRFGARISGGTLRQESCGGTILRH